MQPGIGRAVVIGAVARNDIAGISPAIAGIIRRQRPQPERCEQFTANLFQSGDVSFRNKDRKWKADREDLVRADRGIGACVAHTIEAAAGIGIPEPLVKCGFDLIGKSPQL